MEISFIKFYFYAVFCGLSYGFAWVDGLSKLGLALIVFWTWLFFFAF